MVVKNPTYQFEGNEKIPGSIFQRFCKSLLYIIYYGITITLCDLVKDIFIKPPQINFEELQKRSNQVAVMTGGSRGIGHSIVSKLLTLDYTLILGVRNVTAGEKEIQKIRNSRILTGKVIFFPLDLKSLKSVRCFADLVLACKHATRIDLLINNAGMFQGKYEKTVDGYESIFQVNYLSHFLLTNLLLPRITETAKMKGAPCHIINTCSNAQRRTHINMSDFENSKVHNSINRYFESKFHQLVHTLKLQKNLDEEKSQVYVNACHPGEVFTEIWNGDIIVGYIMKMFESILRNPDVGANMILYPLFGSEHAKNEGGRYFENGNVAKHNPRANDPEIQQSVWDKSVELSTSVCHIEILDKL